MNYCDKMKFLHLSFIGLEKNIPRLYELITHTNKHLKYLSLQFLPSFVLKGLGQILPDSLEYLNLELDVDPNDLKIFLNNCNHVMLN